MKITQAQFWKMAALLLAAAFVMGFMHSTPTRVAETATAAQLAAGEATGEDKIPLGRDKATAPYMIIQPWGEGTNTGKCFDDSDNTVKAGATYANCAVRFDQDAVSKDWWGTIPAELPNGTYKGIVRDGADGAEADTDAAVVTVFFRWNQSSKIVTIAQDAFAIY